MKRLEDYKYKKGQSNVGIALCIDNNNTSWGIANGKFSEEFVIKHIIGTQSD